MESTETAQAPAQTPAYEYQVLPSTNATGKPIFVIDFSLPTMPTPKVIAQLNHKARNLCKDMGTHFNTGNKFRNDYRNGVIAFSVRPTDEQLTAIFGCPPVTDFTTQPAAQSAAAEPPAAEAAAPAPNPPATAPENTASVPLMITHEMEIKLKAKNYTQEDINKMTPQEAHAALAGVDKPKPEQDLRPLWKEQAQAGKIPDCCEALARKIIIDYPTAAAFVTSSDAEATEGRKLIKGDTRTGLVNWLFFQLGKRELLPVITEMRMNKTQFYQHAAIQFLNYKDLTQSIEKGNLQLEISDRDMRIAYFTKMMPHWIEQAEQHLIPDVFINIAEETITKSSSLIDFCNKSDMAASAPGHEKMKGDTVEAVRELIWMHISPPQYLIDSLPNKDEIMKTLPSQFELELFRSLVNKMQLNKSEWYAQCQKLFPEVALQQ